jgi:hypothetical protein
MATTQGSAGMHKEEHKEEKQDPKDVKAKVNKVTAPSGVDKDGKPDGSLSEAQVARAATETLYATRPQPNREEIEAVLKKLAETNEDGQPKQKHKDVDSVISATQAALKEVQKPAA